MDSRSTILSKIKQNKPSIDTSIDLSQFFNEDVGDLTQTYCTNLEANEGNFIILAEEDNLEDLLLKEVEGKTFVDLSGIIQSQPGFDINSMNHPRELADVKVLVIPGKLGVAENAAIWVDDEVMHSVRILPFIVEQTIFILNKGDIVPNMNHAYQVLGKVNSGFGTFIAGPSKTGDIEQNIVIGAHGALSHLVILVQKLDIA